MSTGEQCSVQVMTSAVNQRMPGGGAGSGGGALGTRWRTATRDGDTPVITAGEAALLDQIPTRFADRPWITATDEGMPWTGQLIRPSSAAANLQSHPSYTSGLFDAERPVSAAYLAGGGGRRPKTGGLRFWSHGRTADRRQPVSGGKRDRRLTLTGAEAISESSVLTRQTAVQQRLNADLKVKVRHS